MELSKTVDNLRFMANELKRAHGENPKHETLVRIRTLENAIKELEEKRWIPVEDRLPEESLNSVIGWDEYRKRCCFVQYYCGRWILGNDVDSVKISAWMPLPEPYTEQTKG